MPRPNKGEDQASFVSRYIETREKEGFHNHKQNAAIAYSIWKNRHKKKSKVEDMKKHLMALHEVAEEFEKQGNATAGKILTEAMQKIYIGGQNASAT